MCATTDGKRRSSPTLDLVRDAVREYELGNKEPLELLVSAIDDAIEVSRSARTVTAAVFGAIEWLEEIGRHRRAQTNINPERPDSGTSVADPGVHSPPMETP